jgi:hypothetical protein
LLESLIQYGEQIDRTVVLEIFHRLSGFMKKEGDSMFEFGRVYALLKASSGQRRWDRRKNMTRPQNIYCEFFQ